MPTFGIAKMKESPENNRLQSNGAAVNHLIIHPNRRQQGR
jgi:hypothetical protein